MRETTRIGAFLDWLRETRGLHFDGYPDLWQWSVDDLDGFWLAVTEWSGVRWHDRTVGRARGAGDARRAVVPGRHAQLRRARARGGRRPAPTTSRSSRTEPDPAAARAHVGASSPTRWPGAGPGWCASASDAGDRVAAYLPNIPETAGRVPRHREPRRDLVVVRARVRHPFGRRPLRADRTGGAASPSTATATASKAIDQRAEVAAIEAALPSSRHTVHVRYLGDGDDDWTALLAEPGPLAFDPVPFDHPLYVLYSSGTTGLPKAIVHGHGGITVEHLKAPRSITTSAPTTGSSGSPPPAG